MEVYVGINGEDVQRTNKVVMEFVNESGEKSIIRLGHNELETLYHKLVPESPDSVPVEEEKVEESKVKKEKSSKKKE